MGDPAWGEILSLVNVVLSGLLAIFSARQVRNVDGFGRTLMVIFVAIGLYWAGFYAWVAVTPATTGPLNTILFVRIPFAVTLGMMTAMAVYRYYRGRR